MRFKIVNFDTDDGIELENLTDSFGRQMLGHSSIAIPIYGDCIH